MNEMALPPRHRIRNSNPGSLWPSSLLLGHRGSPQYWMFTREQGRNLLFRWNLNAELGSNPRSPSRQLYPLYEGPARPLQERSIREAKITTHMYRHNCICIIIFSWITYLHFSSSFVDFWTFWIVWRQNRHIPLEEWSRPGLGVCQ